MAASTINALGGMEERLARERSSGGTAGTAVEVPLTDWAEVVTAFRDLFDGLGDIVEDDEAIVFSSLPTDVTTYIAVRRDGRISAAMPLHSTEARASTMRWTAARDHVELAGDGMSYTYQIPAELLAKRR